ncbi:sulfate ABC transporter ATP-binding protein [Clostridia bacterium]|nr:sulfate ABC transporter ATP-binding protein [Clostridia bacterium]
MLELKNIFKGYTTGEFRQEALDGVSIRFRKSEFVAILGPSGSGKTTCLNVIGGLDRYDKGDLLINGKSTKKFTSADWDAYRNNSVGFVFQNYHLIPHLSVADNVEMGMTLSGVSKAEKRKKALAVLDRVGLSDHVHKKPGQLSGGQAQRVAIARALANNPDIILADEPTGALDSTSSRQIMELIREIAGDKLVVMVTHNAAIAEKYADRIVQFMDGEVVSDSNPPAQDEGVDANYKLKKTGMSFFTALNLSARNILTKKWRTALTAFASSIGIIGIALILSLSNGFDKQIQQFESSTMSGFPLLITQSAVSIDAETMQAQRAAREESAQARAEQVKYPAKQAVLPYNAQANTFMHTNVFTDDYIRYIESAPSSLIAGISYTRLVNMTLLTRTGDTGASVINTSLAGITAYPKALASSEAGYLRENYDLLQGAYPAEATDLVFVVDPYNRVNTSVLDALGIPSGDGEIPFDAIIGRTYKLILNDDFYVPYGDLFVPNVFGGLDALYDKETVVTLRIAGILRPKEAYQLNVLPYGLAYSNALSDLVIESAKNSAIVQAQLASDVSVLTGESFSAPSQGMASGGTTGRGASTGLQQMQSLMSSMTGGGTLTKEMMLQVLGATGTPFLITVYPRDFSSKDDLTAYLSAWNDGKPGSDAIIFTDLAETFTSLSGGIMDAITIVLISFAGISLVVSLITIGIITWISVLERTREIGILRALGARKKDITRVFTAETFIIGMCSGLLGISIAYLLTIPVNAILKSLTDISGVAQLNPVHALILLALSVCLTLLGGALPAHMAAKKNPVDALRSE